MKVGIVYLALEPDAGPITYVFKNKQDADKLFNEQKYGKPYFDWHMEEKEVE